MPLSFPVLLQLSSSNTSRAETNSGALEKQVQSPAGAEELFKVRSRKWSAPCSISTDIDRTFGTEINKQSEADDLSSDYIDQLILLSSKARSWYSQDEETVDLVEPRLESFRMANFKAP